MVTRLPPIALRKLGQLGTGEESERPEVSAAG